MTSETSTTNSNTQNMETELVKGIDDKKRIAQLEHEIFTVCKQLDEKIEKLKDAQQQNLLLKERAGSLEQEKLERTKFVESLVQSRDNLIFEKTQLQNDKLSIEQRKCELDLQISKLTNEKRLHLGEIEQLRNTCDALRTDKIELQAKIDDFQSDKSTLAYDKEQWSREKHIMLASKQWYMDEISTREQKINELRVQIIKMKADSQRQIALLNEKNNDLSLSSARLSKSLEEREAELLLLQERMKKVIDEGNSQINEMEAELRTRERLSNVYKESMEKADLEVSEMRENELRTEGLLMEKEEALQKLSSELQENKQLHEKSTKEKDAEIKRLSDEVAKSTELLNAGFRLNRPDEEIIRISPAAAAASSLLKSGMSLTGIYAEHCRVVSELEKKNSELGNLERYVNELIQDLDSRAPKFQEQRKAFEQMTERNECLQLQKDLLSNERQKLQANADSLLRELTFTKRELERYQNEHNILSKQVKHLLFVIEKDSLNTCQANGDSDEDNYLFSNISELQAKNLQLSDEIERLRSEQEKTIENYHNSEIEMLKQACSRSREELARLKENFSKQSVVVRELTEQRDQYKNLYDQFVSTNGLGMSSNASTASEFMQPNVQQPQSLTTLQAEMLMWKTKAERLQETNIYLNEDRQAYERIQSDRLDQQIEQISTMRTTIGKLESNLEFQNKNQTLLSKQIDSYADDLKTATEKLAGANRQVESLELKNDNLTAQLLEKQQRLSTLEVQNHSLTEERAVVLSRDQRLQAELEILRSSRYNTDRVSSTLQEMEALLKRVEAEKANSMDNQLQSALLERDNLRQLIENLNEQHNQLINGLKGNLNAAISERDKILADSKSIQNRLDALERIYEQLKKDYENLQNEMEQIQSTDTNVEACKKEMQKMKNTIAYQEKQLTELEQKCEELNGTIERKDKQLEEICRLGTDMEGTIQFANMERQRMQAVREQLDGELSKNKTIIEELRNSLSARELELLNQTKQFNEASNQLEELSGKNEIQMLEKEKQVHEQKLLSDQLCREKENLQNELEKINCQFVEISENNLRLTTDLAKEISKSESLAQHVSQLTKDCEIKCEKLKKSIDVLEQEKLRLQDEIKAFMSRDEEHVQKQTSLYDEIQQLLKQVEFMERLQHTISSPSPNTSLNVSAVTASTFSPISRFSTATESQGQQQHADRINAIIGYMRSDKQKETELRMNAELELQRIRVKSNIDQQRIFQLESEVSKLTNEVEINAKIAVEKEELVTQMNALGEVQSRYQQIKKSFCDLQQKFAENCKRAQELEQGQAKMFAEKKDLEAKLENSTKIAQGRLQQLKILKDRYDRAMSMASKYSPEIVNSLQGENEKLKADSMQKDNELVFLRKECEHITEDLNKLKTDHSSSSKELEESLEKNKELTSQLQTVKQVARKIRDEKTLLTDQNIKLQAELKSVQDQNLKLQETPLIASTASSSLAPSCVNDPASLAFGLERRKLQEQIEALTVENEALASKVKTVEQLEAVRDEMRLQIENQQRDIEDAAEKVMRMEMVEKAYKNSQEKIKALSIEIRQLQEENERLKKRSHELEQLVVSLEQKRDKEKQQNQQLQLASTPVAIPQIGFTFADAGLTTGGTQHEEELRSPQILEASGSPASRKADASPVYDQKSEQAFIEELEKVDFPDQQIGDDIGEGIFDLERELGNTASVLRDQQLSLQRGDDAYSADLGEDAEIGDEIPNEDVPDAYGQRMVSHFEEVEREHEFEGESGNEDGDFEEVEEIEDEAVEDEEFVDEEEEDVEEELVGEEMNADMRGVAADSSLGAGEPPRKQPRMFEEQQNQHSSEQGRSDTLEHAGDDDDDDIQLL